MENVTVKHLRGVRSQPRHAWRGFLCNKGILQRSTGRSYLRRNVNVNASNDDENTKHQEAGVEGGQREQPGAVTVSEEPPEPKLQLPKDVVQRLKDTVFGFDSFFVTSSENYQASGVLFKGNLRGGDSAATYSKMEARLKAEFGEAYRLYLLEDPSESRPVVVVLPAAATQPPPPPVNEGLLAAALGATTLLTTLNINGAELFNLVLLQFGFDPGLVVEAIPGSLALLAILAAHEAGHAVAARKHGVELAPPLLLPAGLGLLGSFGAITRIKSVVRDRATLGEIAVAGPLAGTAASAAVLLAGLVLTVAGAGGVELDTQSFKDSFLVGALGQLVFGADVFAAEAVDANPLFVAGWAGLVINALNMIPIGELDGGRTTLALVGRRGARSITTLTFLPLIILSFVNPLALYWLLLSLTIQRTPPPPCLDEVSEISEKSGGLRAVAYLALALPLLVLLPFPGGGGAPDFSAFY